jgi:hypothetical protein
MAEEKRPETIFDERIVQQDPTDVFEVADYPVHEDGDEDAPRDAFPGDANTRDEDEDNPSLEGDKDVDERDEDSSL